MNLLTKTLARWVAAIFIQIVTRNARVFLVAGCRRSGNHALVDWVANALEERQVDLLRDPTYGHFNSTVSMRTVFINEMNNMTGNQYFRMFLSKRRDLMRCEFLIISLEDALQSTSYTSWRIPRTYRRIAVHRSTLNVVASRLAKINLNAHQGWSEVGMNVDEAFLRVLREIQVAPNQGWHLWEFDRWVARDLPYRAEFLAALNLDYS